MNMTTILFKKHELEHTNTILLHKEKSVYFVKKMDEVRTINKIEVDFSQEKIDFINDANQKELQHWKKVTLESVSTENEAKELIDLAPSRVCLIRKAKNAKMVNIDEIFFYLMSQYLTHNEEQRTFIQYFLPKYLAVKVVNHFTKVYLIGILT